MVAFTYGGATVQPSIGDDSDEEQDPVQLVDQELIQPLLNIAEEAVGCVSTIEERLRITHSNKSNQSSSNGSSGGGGSWVFGSEKNKNNLYEAIDCPKPCVNTVPNICIDYVVLNDDGTTLSNSSSVGVSNEYAVGNIPPPGQYSNVAPATGGINNSSNSNGKSLAVKPTNNFSETMCILQDESTSENSCVATNNYVNINQSRDSFSNVAQATGRINDSSNSNGKSLAVKPTNNFSETRCIQDESTRSTSENSYVTTNNYVNESRDSLTRNALSNSIEKGEHDFNSNFFWGVGNEPLSIPAAMPAHIHMGWEWPEENSQNSLDSVSIDSNDCMPLYREQ
ncbi:unnamed protein product, partial [Rotaria magnacalcarata]